MAWSIQSAPQPSALAPPPKYPYPPLTFMFQGKAVCLLSVSAPKSVWTAHGTPTNSGLACALLLYYYNPVMTNRALPLGKLDAQKPEQR